MVVIHVLILFENVSWVKLIYMVFPHPHYKAVDVSTAQSGEEPKKFLVKIIH